MNFEKKTIEDLREMQDDGPVIGVYKVCDADYHAFKAINSTSVKAASTSMADFKAVYDPDECEPSKERAGYFAFGTALHALMLDREEFERSFTEKPAGVDFRTKAGKEWRAENAGKHVLSEWDSYALGVMSANIEMSDTWQKFTEKEYATEIAVFWLDETTGMQCKAKFDLMSPDHGVLDLKTTSNKVTDYGIKNAIRRYNYDIQGAHYGAALQHAFPDFHQDFVLGFVEKSQPFSFRAASISKRTRQVAREHYESLMSDIHYSLKHNYYPGPGNNNQLEVSLYDHDA
jgi:hypothetical protein